MDEPTPSRPTMRISDRLPLLDKELRELAAKPRTYTVRCLYATILFGAAGLLLHAPIQSSSSHGIGKAYLVGLVAVNLIAIIVILPPMMMNLVTADRERGTTDLLSVTAMTPMEIVVQKYISGLIPMFTLLLMSLPLLAITYSLGGVKQTHLWASVYLIFLAPLVIGALALASAVQRKNLTTAILSVYGMLPGPLLILTPFAIVAMYVTPDLESDNIYLPFILGACGLPPIFFTSIFLQKAIRAWRRLPEMHHRQLVQDAQQWSVQSPLGGRSGLPGDEPISWREGAISRRTINTGLITIGVTVILALPLIVIVHYAQVSSGRAVHGLSMAILFGWILLVALTAFTAAGVVAGERMRQTLDVLLTTPMNAADILRQKMRNANRCALIGTVVLAVLVLIEFFFRLVQDRGDPVTYLLASLSAVIIYPLLFAWTALWLGMRSKRPSRASWNAAALLIIWVLIPAVFMHNRAISEGVGYLLLLSPGTIVVAAEWDARFFKTLHVNFIVANTVIHAVLLFGIRGLVLLRANRLLGRA